MLFVTIVKRDVSLISGIVFTSDKMLGVQIGQGEHKQKWLSQNDKMR